MDKITVGFSGTQIGMTAAQAHRLIVELIHSQHKISEVHHGDCMGADEQFHFFIKQFFSDIPIIGHPPTEDRKRAFCEGYDEVRDPKPYPERNQDIVDETQRLIATPKREEVLRSGTWSVVRKARNARKEVLIIYPNGSTDYEFE